MLPSRVAKNDGHDIFRIFVFSVSPSLLHNTQTLSFACLLACVVELEQT